MGLFGGGKKLCPVCGSPAAWFLPTKIEDQPLCGECAGKGSQVPTGVASDLTLEEFRAFLALYDENQALRGIFQETYGRGFGFLGGSISLDVPHRLFRLNRIDGAFVFEASNLRRFRISEDDAPLFEGTKDELACYESAIPAQVEGMSAELNRYKVEQRQYEQMKHMDEMMKRQAEQHGETYSTQYIPSPDVDRLKPFRKFRLLLELDRPYGKKDKAEYEEDAPGFYSLEPTITGYMQDYRQRVGDMRELAVNLMAVMNPAAPERQVSAPTAQAGPSASSSADPVAEIQRYKVLLDSGAITEEEFTAKKRQLLGI